MYGHKQTSHARTKFGNHLRSSGRARITGFFDESACEPDGSYEIQMQFLLKMKFCGFKVIRIKLLKGWAVDCL